MDQTENRYDVSLPEGLRGQFAELEHRLWRIETCVAIGLALTGLLGSYLLLFLSDRLWDTPFWLRSLLALGGALALLGRAGWSRLWLWQRRVQKGARGPGAKEIPAAGRPFARHRRAGG